jgi:hypothetical protein
MRAVPGFDGGVQSTGWPTMASSWRGYVRDRSSAMIRADRTQDGSGDRASVTRFDGRTLRVCPFSDLLEVTDDPS